MDTKRELIARLEDICPEARGEITAILADYRVTRETGREGDLRKRITVFLSAKKIDGLSVKTLKNYREMLGAFAAQVDKPAARVTADDVREYIGYLAEERRLKDSSINTHINTLRSFFGWLDTEDMIKRNPMRKIKPLKIDRTKARRPLTGEQLERLRDGCRTYKEKALVEFLVSSGCRLGEVVGLRTDAVDWQGRSVVVLGKGNKERIVYLNAACQNAIEDWLTIRAMSGAADPHALFITRKHTRITKAGVHYMLKQRFTAAGLDSSKYSAHKLRHTAATLMLQNGVDVRTLQEVLGHEHLNTTQIYTHVDSDALRDAAQSNPLGQIKAKPRRGRPKKQEE